MTDTVLPNFIVTAHNKTCDRLTSFNLETHSKSVYLVYRVDRRASLSTLGYDSHREREAL